MMGFTLSKMNLLILVTAIFAIIAFFMMHLLGIMVGWTAQRMVNEYIGTIDGLARSTTPYFKETITVPDSISYFGGIGESNRFFYVIEIAREPEEYNPKYLTKVILKIASRKEQDKFIATKSSDINAQVYLYQWPVSEGSITTNIAEQSSITIDPYRGLGTFSNSMVLVKESYKGKNYMHIVVCSSASGQCDQNLKYAACCIEKCRGTKSNYLPEPEACPPSLSCYGNMDCG
ncbi:MAG: hypothetical protein JW744_03785 [Candidatus Diapherotrites archaeon]|uniref:Uncharacterized protein n=1 Tax=Candidatus Iainarchaeum sp. TaxID=3101447 RepID=A0A939C909_9ARCH|nr:hypothetical protein [Candidatus Diapherotrites archaeon]